MLPTEADGILGLDFFADKNAELDLGKLQLRLKKGASIKHGYENQRVRQARSEAGCVALSFHHVEGPIQSRRMHSEGYARYGGTGAGRDGKTRCI